MDKDYLFIKHLKCPCCEETINKKTLRTSKIRPKKRLLSLRTIYEDYNLDYYELVWCNKCGYCVLEPFNKVLMNFQKKALNEKLCKNYIPLMFETDLNYNTREIILGYKLAIYNSILLNYKNIEKAYLIYKYTFILDSLIDDDKLTRAEKIELIKERKQLYQKILEGLELSFGLESSEIISDDILLYIMCYISLYLYNSERKIESEEYINYLKNIFEKNISKLISSKTITKTLKDNCLKLKELYKKIKTKEEAKS